MINKIFDKKYEKYERKTYIESEIDKFLEKYEDKDINITCGDKSDKNRFGTEEITKLLKKLRNKFINFDEFNEEYNKFIDNIAKFEYLRKMIRYARDLKYIVGLYNIKSGSDTSKKDEGLKILTNKQMLNRLPMKMKRDKYYTRYICQKY